MQRSVKAFLGYQMRCTDGVLGSVRDLLFDDTDWVTRYLVAATGTWMRGRRVLLAPSSLDVPDWEGKVLPVHLSHRDIETAPSLNTDPPVSRRREEELATAAARWPALWTGHVPGLPGIDGSGLAVPVPDHTAASGRVAQAGDPHLRSAAEVVGYDIEARDGTMGRVADLVIDTAHDWMITYLVVDFHRWLPGKQVVLAPAWAEHIEWADRVVRMDLSKKTIAEAPAFDPGRPVNHEYEDRLYDYYGRPRRRRL
jgi:hypothetical protein